MCRFIPIVLKTTLGMTARENAIAVTKDCLSVTMDRTEMGAVFVFLERKVCAKRRIV